MAPGCAPARPLSAHVDPGGRRRRRVPAGASLALSTAFWTYSLVAEVFALNDLFAALLLLVLLEWYREPARVRLLWLFALLSGLAATNQQTIVISRSGLPVCSSSSGLRRARRDRRLPLGQARPRPAFLVLGLLPTCTCPSPRPVTR